MALSDKSHNLFHPLVARWSDERVGPPTDIQNQAWSKIASREHVLITAPTGSGKTLAAFLWTLNQLVTGQWPTGQTSVLYVSPVRALNNDIQRNLLGPLEELREVFLEAGDRRPACRCTAVTPPSLPRSLRIWNAGSYLAFRSGTLSRGG